MPSETHLLFLGCGAVTRRHSRTLRSIGNVALSFASTDAARAQAYRDEFRGVGCWGSYAQALADSPAQVVVVATPTVTHAALAKQALLAGKYVIIEKPAFMNVAEADAICGMDAGADQKVFVAENYVYKPMTCRIREAIQNDELGDVRFVSINGTRFQPAVGWRAHRLLSGGGALFEAGVHWISFAARIGLDVAKISAWRAGQAAGTDLSSLTVLQYSNGAVGTIMHSWELQGILRGARLSKIQGTRGSITFESHGAALFNTGARPGLRVYPTDTFGYGHMFRDFLRVVQHGGHALYTLRMAQSDFVLMARANAMLESAESTPEGAG